jgi:hypothetical protein
MNLFSQLDQAANMPSEQVTMVRYRTRFHKDIIYSQLNTNPDKSFADLSAAVAINEPARFLPQPWPPILITDESTLTIVALIKMKDIVNIGLGLPAAHSALLTDFISRKFPKRLSIVSIRASAPLTDQLACG